MLTKQNIMLAGILVAVYYLYMMNRKSNGGTMTEGAEMMA